MRVCLLLVVALFVAGNQACNHQNHKSKHAHAQVKIDCGKYKKGSTMCLHPANCIRAKARGGECGKVSEQDKQLILDEHNAYRQKVAAGLEKRGSPGPQRAGTNIFKLEWSDELASFAERWSEQKEKNPHDCYIPCRQTPKYKYVGQNVYWVYCTLPLSGTQWDTAVKRWYDEVKDVDQKTFKSPEKKAIGHYTQLLWADTKQVGCAVFGDNQKCGWKTPKYSRYYCQKYVCNYGPAGNFNNQPVYSTTKKCIKYSKEFPNLCVE